MLSKSTTGLLALQCQPSFGQLREYLLKSAKELLSQVQERWQSQNG